MITREKNNTHILIRHAPPTWANTMELTFKSQWHYKRKVLIILIVYYSNISILMSTKIKHERKHKSENTKLRVVVLWETLSRTLTLSVLHASTIRCRMTPTDKSQQRSTVKKINLKKVQHRNTVKLAVICKKHQKTLYIYIYILQFTYINIRTKITLIGNWSFLHMTITIKKKNTYKLCAYRDT